MKCNSASCQKTGNTPSAFTLKEHKREQSRDAYCSSADLEVCQPKLDFQSDLNRLPAWRTGVDVALQSVVQYFLGKSILNRSHYFNSSTFQQMKNLLYSLKYIRHSLESTHCVPYVTRRTHVALALRHEFFKAHMEDSMYHTGAVQQIRNIRNWYRHWRSSKQFLPLCPPELIAFEIVGTLSKENQRLPVWRSSHGLIFE